MKDLRVYLKHKKEGIGLALGLLDIKRRIRSVKNTQKITKAVGLVATSKFGKLRPAAYRVSAYFDKYRSVMENTFLSMNIKESLFYKSNNSDTDLYIIITSDSGLCGNYNLNAINTALKHMHGKKVLLITIGERGRNYFKKRGYETLSEFVEIGIDPELKDINSVMEGAVDYFKQGKAANVYIVYTKFYSPIKQEALVMRVLPALEAVDKNNGTFKYGESQETISKNPVMPESGSTEVIPPVDLYLFEPSFKEVFEFVFPKYLNSLMYYTIINSISSEYALRITSMDGATRNASDILDRLQNIYNKVRQSSITQEITEIVSGAEALKR